MKQTILKQKLKAFLDEKYGPWAWDEKSQCYYDEPYRGYDDIIDDKTIGEILDSKYPMETLEEKCYDWWEDAAWQREMELVNEFTETLTRQSWDDDKIREELESMWYFKYPIDEYLEQEVCVDICIDTGDANYDYTLNAVYPHYNGREGEEIDDRASLVWLAKTQGYSKEQLQHALNTLEDSLERHGFLETVYDELINCCVSLPALFFPVKMTLGKLIELQEIINKRDEDEYRWEPEDRKDCGSIVVSKDVECLLYDSWNGGGSCWGIQLEKDVEIPIKYIRSAEPDGAKTYSIKSCYGCNSSCWKDAIKQYKF